MEDAQILANLVFERFLHLVQSRRAPENDLRYWFLEIAENLYKDRVSLKNHSGERKAGLLAKIKLADLREIEQEDLEDVQRFSNSLKHLSADHQRLLALRFVCELSLDEIAQIMRKRLNQVKEMQLYALLDLQRLVEKTD